MAWLLIQFVRLYRVSVGTHFAGHCRFHPTCSQYAMDALAKHGAIKGSIKTVWRLLRCVNVTGRELEHDPA
jgi:uncharacterized protein